MQRLTMAIDDELMDDLDRLIAARGYQSRSKAIRDLARAGLQQVSAETTPDQQCIAALVCTYDHTRRDLSQRLTETFHHHHAQSLSTLHVHLDQARCMEVTVLRGLTSAVRHFADHVIAERGPTHGRFVVLSAGHDRRVGPGPTSMPNMLCDVGWEGRRDRRSVARRLP